MPSFITTLPIWVLVLIGAVLAYIGYRYWQYKKSTAYTPDVTRLTGGDFTTPRDNPKSGG